MLRLNSLGKWRRLLVEAAKSGSPAGGVVWSARRVGCGKTRAVAHNAFCRCESQRSKALVVWTFEKMCSNMQTTQVKLQQEISGYSSMFSSRQSDWREACPQVNSRRADGNKEDR